MISRVWAVTLTVSDLKPAMRFYEEVLGLRKKYEFKDYAGFDCGGVEIGLRTWGGLERSRKGEPCIDLLVDDVDEVCRLLKERGAEIRQEPQDAVWGARFALFCDPDGNGFQLTQINWPKYFAACAPR
jgi:predicted enzyme related to lactoylglutathione lyase